MKLFVASLTTCILAKPNDFKRKTLGEPTAERKAGKREFQFILALCQIYLNFLERSTSWVYHVGNELDQTCQQQLAFEGFKGKVTSVDNGKRQGFL